MPIYEFYCPDNNRIYQFYAKTLAQGRTVPRCPDGPKLRMERIFSPFAVTGKQKQDAGSPPSAAAGSGGAGGAEGPDDARLDAAMGALEGEMAGMDENDPRAMGRMMRRMAELTGERIDGEMEEVVRKLEEGADPESLEERMGADGPGPDEGGPGLPEGGTAGDPAADRRRSRLRRSLPVRDPKLYDYEQGQS